MPAESSNIVGAFTTVQAARLTGVSRRQLSAWHRNGFFSPSIIAGEARSAYTRFYSFRDLLSLKVLNQLRNETQVSMDHLKKVKNDLAHLGEDMWVKSTLYLLGKRVVIARDDDSRHEAGSGQEVFRIPLRVVVGGMRERIQEFNKRNSDEIGQIVRQRGVVHSQAVIAGTRIPVATIKEFADAGYTVPQILLEYPSLNEDDVEAALAFGGERSAA
ncbi:Uncharacterized conserved protein, DUF433 family [Devosia enhydra]|uniref:Uncharacterized conserved protein, DUF433 family n=1 Tax=Devosia enhydra TaxID=665118 RepID=A0A1K2HXP2_9HYPH|nr:DUF433 domain-containing protein [Devosia enhydra]SFZ83769.1 Uncharacterized conserved protein, DUF433 family [Devosia enhydra]